jgi:hypothetical protein
MKPLAAASLCAFAFCTLPGLAQEAQPDTHYAPPPLEVDGVVGIPIDISKLEASIVLDVAKKAAATTADMHFELTADGMPLFDLRQDVAKLSLNGMKLDPALLGTHSAGPGGSTMRILHQELKAGQSYHLHFEYDMKKPKSKQAQGIAWGDGDLHWDFFFSDLNPGRYLEQWFPANLIYDRFPVELDLQIKSAKNKHQLVTNASVDVIKKQKHWKLSFPAQFTAFSQMLVVVPDDQVTRSTSEVEVQGRTITIDVCKLNRAKTTLENVHELAAGHLQEFSADPGMWPHGDRCTIFVWTGGRSMEYDGSTTTSMGALEHELFHSWFGRGLKPVSQNDGWFDEAWTVWFADNARVSAKQIKNATSPVALFSDNPHNRTTSMHSYRSGAMFFSRLAQLLGKDKLKELMKEFYHKYYATGASTDDMAQFLHQKTQNDEVLQLFHRFIYGRDGHVKDQD